MHSSSCESSEKSYLTPTYPRPSRVSVITYTSHVHEMRRVRFIARGTAIATGGTCWARLDGPWVHVDVVAFNNGGVSRITIDGRERFVTLSAYYTDEQSTAAEAG